jgi:ABC-type uncharacterized transport system YnjBCD substrate-binding protein
MKKLKKDSETAAEGNKKYYSNSKELNKQLIINYNGVQTMKKLLNIGLFALILVFFTTQIVSAQYSSGLNPAVQSPNGAMLVQFKSVLDSLDENYSKTIFNHNDSRK